MQSITDTSANRSAIPEYLYCLSLEPQRISVILQWNSDLVETGLNYGFSSATENFKTYTSITVSFEVTSEALPLFKKDDDKDAVKNKQAFLNNFGHKFLESYTEQAPLNAVWHLRLRDGTPEDFYTLHMSLQKYFLGPRTVPEVCGFLSTPENLCDGFHRLRDVEVKVSIFGYRNEFTRKPQNLNGWPLADSHHYLTSDALSRNMNKKTLTMRPWQGLYVKDLSPADNHVAKDIPPVAPEEFFVPNTRKAERHLLPVKLYSQALDSGVKEATLSDFGKKLDGILDPSSLQNDTGTMIQQRKDSLINLVRHLDKALRESDLESTAGKASGAVVDENEE